MKTFVAAACLVALTLAEPPPSNSYLPPPPSGRSGASSAGYPRGGPQTRNLQHGPDARGNGFGSGRFGGEQGYDQNAQSPFGRNGLDDASGEPANYNFGYMVNDFREGTDFGHHEERQDERAEGEYHVVLPDGRKQTVSYEADERGFKPRISYEDTDTQSQSRSGGGYDSNANNIGGHGNSRSHGNGHHSNGQHGSSF